jgi:hypothetical protein
MKKKNPNDATFRNINALKKRLVKLEGHFEGLLIMLSMFGHNFSESISVKRSFIKFGEKDMQPKRKK